MERTYVAKKADIKRQWYLSPLKIKIVAVPIKRRCTKCCPDCRMRNLKLEIEYDGSNYCGWQAQGKSNIKYQISKIKTIQESIEKVLQKILQEKIRLIGSGRTDAGVHALAQVANFKTKAKISLEKLQRALNSLLPDDIVISKIKQVNPDFHSRFDVRAKSYRYTILNRSYPSVFLRNRVYCYPHSLDVKLMRDESRLLLGRHNFASFQASDSSIKNTLRTIKSLNITKSKDLIYIDIEADGFLYNMVRNIIGTLIQIGRAKLKKGELKKILLAKDRRLAGPTAPAYGLCLIKVKY